MRKTSALILVAVLTTGAVLACGPSPAPTPDTQATVNAAVAATDTARASMQGTIDAAVQATGAAAPTPPPATAAGLPPEAQATIDAAVQATMSAAQATAAAAPTPTPSADYTTMTEEEVAALIDEAVVEAVAATEECSTAASEVALDGVVTAEEVALVEAYLAAADEAIAYAEELLTAYDDLYGELATATLAALEAVEDDLLLLADELDGIEAVLTEMEVILQQGLTLAGEVIAELGAAAEDAAALAAEVQDRAQEWFQALPAEMEARVNAALSVLPSAVPSDLQAAIRSALDYVNTVRQSLADLKLTSSELASIAQAGANAAAGLKAYGGPKARQLADSINEITAQLARGQIPTIESALAGLESALGALPPRP